MSDAIERPAGGAPPWEYASAPESTDIVRLEDRYGLFIGGEFVEPKSGRWFPTISPSTEETLAEVAEADTADVARAVDAARDAAPAWQALAPAERAKYVFRIARQLQERAREFAVLETMNGGKPIKESRDVDVPLAAAHFFYYAGWADKLEYAFPGRGTPGPVGVAGQIIPWNFPLLMAAWKLAPALAAGNTRRAEARRDDAAHRAAARPGDAGGRDPARRREHRDRGRGDRRRARRCRRRQDRVHRLDRGRQGDPTVDGRQRASASRSSSAARPRTSCSRTRRSTRRSRA